VPVLLAGDDIVWIPGYTRSDVAKISVRTTRIARIRAVHFAL
jgi:hypothetical protein